MTSSDAGELKETKVSYSLSVRSQFVLFDPKSD